jgi:ParB-like chromosome segregation protein Spo0J
VKELKVLPKSKLVPNPSNPKVHPSYQEQVVRASLEKLGQVAPLLAVPQDDGTYMLLDGHLRLELLPEKVAVAVVDLTPEEARDALLLLDPTVSLADYDPKMLEELVNSADLEGLLADFANSLLTKETIVDNPVEFEPLPPPDVQAPEEVVNEGVLARVIVLFPDEDSRQAWIEAHGGKYERHRVVYEVEEITCPAFSKR